MRSEPAIALRLKRPRQNDGEDNASSRHIPDFVLVAPSTKKSKIQGTLFPVRILRRVGSSASVTLKDSSSTSCDVGPVPSEDAVGERLRHSVWRTAWNDTISDLQKVQRVMRADSCEGKTIDLDLCQPKDTPSRSRKRRSPEDDMLHDVEEVRYEPDLENQRLLDNIMQGMDTSKLNQYVHQVLGEENFLFVHAKHSIFGEDQLDSISSDEFDDDELSELSDYPEDPDLGFDSDSASTSSYSAEGPYDRIPGQMPSFPAVAPSEADARRERDRGLLREWKIQQDKETRREREATEEQMLNNNAFNTNRIMNPLKNDIGSSDDSQCQGQLCDAEEYLDTEMDKAKRKLGREMTVMERLDHLAKLEERWERKMEKAQSQSHRYENGRIRSIFK